MFLCINTTADCKTKEYKPTDKTFAEFSKGIVDINMTRYIYFDTHIDLITGILKGKINKGKWKDEAGISSKILNVVSPEHLSDAEVLIAQPIFDEDYKKIEGYYFVVYLSEWSKPGSNGRGYCGAGIENELVVLLTDKAGNITSETRRLVNSCLKPVGGLFIRDSAPENLIYVIYYDSGEMKLIKIDYLYPKKGIVEIKGKME